MAEEFTKIPGNRGRMMMFLRAGPQSVNELAEALEMTDNGVRAHLDILQQDGLVAHAGERPGLRKPHQLFALTPAGRARFPTAEGPLLHQILAGLEGTMSSRAMAAFLKRVGHDMAEAYLPELKGASLEKRLALALKVLAKIGGVAAAEHQDGKTFIQGRHCPLTNLVPAHPEVCAVAQGLLERILDQPVQECCQKGTSPACRFALSGK